ncbi:hypothetical protein [Hymenobacter baengnokdamensis]|uniref:hypothetical protein n=1 Tax=Hymenobacter baengnokdamensis TaxID=2615203 RepID=UPI001244D491|nr:hypothetical protein [Hymenobacter baengnokdamensis]
MKITHRRPVSLTSPTATRRTRLLGLVPGTTLIPLGAPLDVAGYWHQGDKLTAYVAGTMPPHLRTACEEGCTHEEEWFGPLPAGIREIDLSECRYEYLVQQPAYPLPLFPGTDASHIGQAA